MQEHSENDFSTRGMLIRSAKSFAAIPFTKVENVHDIIFDSRRINLSQSVIDQNISFLKKAKIGNLVFADTDKPSFTISDKSNGSSITASNRASQFELRGAKLREVVAKAKAKNPDHTAYSVLNTYLQNPLNTDVVMYAKASVCQPELGNPIPETHFNVYVGLLVSEAQNQTLIPAEVVVDPDRVANLVIQDINVGKLYDLGAEFSNLASTIESRAGHFKQTGHPEAAEELQNISNALHKLEQLLLTGEINAKQFSDNLEQIQNQVTLLEPIHATEATSSEARPAGIMQDEDEEINATTVADVSEGMSPLNSSTKSLSDINAPPVTLVRYDPSVLDNLDDILKDTLGIVEQLNQMINDIDESMHPLEGATNSTINSTKSFKRALAEIVKEGTNSKPQENWENTSSDDNKFAR